MDSSAALMAGKDLNYSLEVRVFVAICSCVYQNVLSQDTGDILYFYCHFIFLLLLEF
jgi:hypothetical protein